MQWHGLMNEGCTAAPQASGIAIRQCGQARNGLVASSGGWYVAQLDSISA